MSENFFEEMRRSILKLEEAGLLTKDESVAAQERLINRYVKAAQRKAAHLLYVLHGFSNRVKEEIEQ